MRFFCYQIILHLLFVIYLPLILIRLFFSAKHRKMVLPFFLVQKIKSFAKEDNIIWLHAISFGETQVIKTLIPKIKSKYPNSKIIVSTITATGQELAKQIDGVYWTFYYPFDTYIFILRLFNKLNPQKIIIIENDIWLALLHLAKTRDIPVYLVNGKISDKSYNFYRRSSIFKYYLSTIKFFAVQSDRYRDLFFNLKIDKQKINVTGNIKLDQVAQKITKEQKEKLLDEWGIEKKQKIIVFASTHNKEEKIAIEVINKLSEKNYTYIIVPRHPERFTKVAGILQDNNINFSLIDNQKHKQHNIILFNKMGLLKEVYSICDIALVCGSWVENVGGHNIFEPAFFYKKFIYGPYMHKQENFVYLSKKYNLGIQCVESEISNKIILLDSKDDTLDKKYDLFFKDCQGAVTKTINLI